MKGIVLITGASGFLGSHLCRYFSQQGWDVRPMVRKPETYAGAFRFDLSGPIDESVFKGRVDALIHCAYEMDPKNPKASAVTNVEGTRRLLELARKHHVGRFVFISSLAAMEEAESFYGRSKLQIERLLDPNRDLVIRPGLVVGRGGLFQHLRESIRRTRIVPLFFGGRQMTQTVWIEDLCLAIEGAIQKEITGVLKVAELDSISIQAFYEGIASLEGKRPLFLRLPGEPTLILLRFLERFGLQLPVTSENLLGLKHMRALETQADLEKIGIKIRSFSESLRSPE